MECDCISNEDKQMYLMLIEMDFGHELDNNIMCNADFNPLLSPPSAVP